MASLREAAGRFNAGKHSAWHTGQGRLKGGVWDWTSAVPSGLAMFWRTTQR